MSRPVDLSNLDALFDAQAPPPARTGPSTYYSDVPWYGDLLACTACGCRSEAARVVPGDGPLSARIAFLGRNPGKDEDRVGVPFVGRAGGELESWFEALGVSRSRVVVWNLVKCHTRDDRPPTSSEIQTCASRWLRRELQAYVKVQVLVTLGDDATRFVLKEHAPKLGKGLFFPVRVSVDGEAGRQVTVIPVAHPSYVLHRPSERSLLLALMARTAEYLTKQVPGVLTASRESP